MLKWRRTAMLTALLVLLAAGGTGLVHPAGRGMSMACCGPASRCGTAMRASGCCRVEEAPLPGTGQEWLGRASAPSAPRHPAVPAAAALSARSPFAAPAGRPYARAGEPAPEDAPPPYLLNGALLR